jgi:hypothetical protein
MCWLDVLFCLRAEGCSCSLDVLYGGLGISELQFLITNFSWFFFKTLDPDSDSMNPDHNTADRYLPRWIAEMS